MWSIPVSVDIQIEGRRGGGREGAILLGECQESNINVPARARVGVCIGQKVQRKIPGHAVRQSQCPAYTPIHL